MMGRIILFSPVGGTDPVSNTNFYDGALIHIARVYKPDKIYLYMSKLTMEWEAEDGRYAYCLERLYENMDKDLDYEKIERPELTEVQDFDYFYDDYKAEITTIMSTMNKDDTLLINTSSGTPGMKSALVVLATIGDIDGSLIQVTTPEKTINQHDHKDYDVETLWKLDPDNEPGFENRCKIIECPSLYQVKNEELLKRLLSSYDYHAALNVAESMPEKYTKEYKYLIEYAYRRSMLDYPAMLVLEHTYEINDFLPVRSDTGRTVVEYALSLFMKVESGSYADFVRGITPLILEVFVRVVKKLTGLNPYEFCEYNSKINSYIWSQEKLEGNTQTTEWVSIWKERFKGDFKFGFVSSQTLLYLILEYGNENEKTLANQLREIEDKIRNIAAHQIKAVTDELIKRVVRKDSRTIVKLFKDMFKCTDIETSKNTWNSYRDMNDYIIAQINSAPRVLSHDS